MLQSQWADSTCQGSGPKVPHGHLRSLSPCRGHPLPRGPGPPRTIASTTGPGQICAPALEMTKGVLPPSPSATAPHSPASPLGPCKKIKGVLRLLSNHRYAPRHQPASGLSPMSHPHNNAIATKVILLFYKEEEETTHTHTVLGDGF